MLIENYAGYSQIEIQLSRSSSVPICSVHCAGYTSGDFDRVQMNMNLYKSNSQVLFRFTSRTFLLNMDFGRNTSILLD